MKIANSIVIGAVILSTAAIATPAADDGKKNTGSTPQEITIPKDAVPNSDGNTFTYTDKEGKKWVYAKTPFGVMKRAVKDETATTKSNEGSAKTTSAAPVSTKANDLTRAIDKGDTVRFERQSPFGVISWEKKKSELTEKERQIFESQNAKTEQK
jgi:hypothetical protein